MLKLLQNRILCALKVLDHEVLVFLLHSKSVDEPGQLIVFLLQSCHLIVLL